MTSKQQRVTLNKSVNGHVQYLEDVYSTNNLTSLIHLTISSYATILMANRAHIEALKRHYGVSDLVTLLGIVLVLHARSIAGDAKPQVPPNKADSLDIDLDI